MIADLGLACLNIRPDEQDTTAQKVDEPFAVEEDSIKTSWAGSAAWIAPEVTVATEQQNFKRYSSYGFKADVFSFGMVMFEVLTCRIPWMGSEYTFAQQIMRAVMAGERPSVSAAELENAPAGFVALMEKCWSTEASERPSFKEAWVELQELLLRK